MITSMYVFVSLMPFVFNTILFDDNFEDTTMTGWTTSGTVQCQVDPAPNKWWLHEDINPDFVRVQYHGLVSLTIIDDSDSEAAYAVHSFPAIPPSTEYLVEFYFHFDPGNKNTFKNFYLYRPTLMIEDRSTPTDITVKLNVVKGDSLPVSVIDNQGLHTNVYYFRPDTLYSIDYGDTHNIPEHQWWGVEDFPIERWYRVQIHKVSADSIALYINGEYIDVYESLSGDYAPDQFLIGTTVPLFEGGVGTFDDFIITTPPQGSHPRLLFNALELPELRARKTDNTSTIQRTYQTYWNKIVEKSNGFKNNRNVGTYPYILPFPYKEPRYSPDSIYFLVKWFWDVDVVERIPRRFETMGLRWIIGELDPSNPEPDTAFLNYVRTTINSFANWNHWMKPLEYRGLIMKHNSTFEFALSLGYDIVFDSLSNYQKMSVQNALLSQGIVPQYLCWKTRGFEDPWVPYYPGHPQWISGMIGFMALVLDDDSLRNFYADFSEAIIESLYIGAQETEMIPVFGPVGQYAHGSMSYSSCNLNWLTPFWEANRRVRNRNIFQDLNYKNRFENYPLFRIYMLCPGVSEEFRSGNDYRPNAPWHMSFCYVTNQQNGQGQWFYKRLYSYNVSPSDEWSDYHYWGMNFLFFDDDLTPQIPTFTIGKNFGNFWIGMRTGFGLEYPGGVSDANEVALVFDAYGKTPIHMHQSRNNFVIGSQGSWLINEHAGFKTNYQSLYHNIIVVDSIWNNGDGNYGQQSDSRGDFQGFHTDNNYCYCANGVAEGCYTRMKKFIRRIIFTKEGYVVIKDEVESSNPLQPRTYLWLVHVNPDQVYGDSLIEKTNKFHIKFFSPSSREIHSWPANTPPPPDYIPSYGAYVTNSTPAVTTEFLTVIVTKRSGYAWPPSIMKIDGSTMLGADVNSQVVILYSKGQNGGVTGTTYYINHSFPFGLKNILADLIPDHSYAVYLNSQYATSFISTEQGTGYFVVSSMFSENDIEVTDTPHD